MRGHFSRTAKCPRKDMWVLTRLVFSDGSDLAWPVIPHTHAHVIYQS